ncbi:MAG: efflux transporter outer membrane subunit [Rhodanobacteraceae bacterium]
MPALFSRYTAADMSRFRLQHHRIVRLLLAMACSGALAACATVKVPPLPRGDLPSAWRNAPPGVAAPAPDLRGWWKTFDDPQLNALVDRALNDNLDVQQAALRLRAARALERKSGTEFLPRLSFQTIEEPNPQNTASYFQAGFDSTWEFGLFGRAEATRHIAAAEVGAAAEELQSARVSLVAEVVRAYLQLRGAQRSEALLEFAAQSTQEKLRLLRVRERLRLASALEVDHAIADDAAAQEQLVKPRFAITQNAQTLALLLGRSEPDPAWLRPAPLPRLAATGFDSVPANLLRTRPEIRTAEANVLKAAGQLGIAQADLYPHIALGSSLTFAALVKGQTRLGDVNDTFAIGPIIDIPLFDWGERRAVRDARDAQLQAALLAYRQAVLQGAADVENALAALHAQDQRVTQTRKAAEALQSGARMTRKLRQLGQADGLDLADAQAALSKAQLDAEQAREEQDIAFVALYKALGGAPLPADNEAPGATPAAGTH